MVLNKIYIVIIFMSLIISCNCPEKQNIFIETGTIEKSNNILFVKLDDCYCLNNICYPHYVMIADSSDILNGFWGIEKDTLFLFQENKDYNSICRIAFLPLKINKGESFTKENPRCNIYGGLGSMTYTCLEKIITQNDSIYTIKHVNNDLDFIINYSSNINVTKEEYSYTYKISMRKGVLGFSVSKPDVLDSLILGEFAYYLDSVR